jgi:hypothetical protein
LEPNPTALAAEDGHMDAAGADDWIANLSSQDISSALAAINPDDLMSMFMLFPEVNFDHPFPGDPVASDLHTSAGH